MLLLMDTWIADCHVFLPSGSHLSAAGLMMMVGVMDDRWHEWSVKLGVTHWAAGRHRSEKEVSAGCKSPNGDMARGENIYVSQWKVNN